jgi:Na+-transporting NADH:ubiquinone oxidoreductase subunit NqrD
MQVAQERRSGDAHLPRSPRMICKIFLISSIVIVVPAVFKAITGKAIRQVSMFDETNPKVVSRPNRDWNVMNEP